MEIAAQAAGKHLHFLRNFHHPAQRVSGILRAELIDRAFVFCDHFFQTCQIRAQFRIIDSLI